MTPHDIASAAARYVDRGWAVVQLYDVIGGSCSCGSADPEHAYKQGGKHPIGNGWQNRGLRTLPEVADAWARRPGANLGIVTGRASGIWVLDVDPDNGGDKQLAALVSAFGALPETYAVRTGSGGTHYYWLMPDFDFTNSRGRLPLGLDVRANASQVVAPPSHTLKGGYAVVLDVAPVAAPGWMLDMVRPPPAPDPAQMPAWSGWDPGALDAAVLERGPAYARTATRDLLAQLAAAQPGERNTIAYRVGRRLAELVAAPWARLDPDAVWTGYLAAAAACDIDGGFTQTEATEVLTKAVRDQAHTGRVAQLPPADHLGTVVNWTPLPDFDQPGQVPGPAGQVTAPATADMSAPASTVDEAFESAVRVEMGRLMVRAEATRRLAEKDKPRPVPLLTGDDLDSIPAPVPLVSDWLFRDTLARIIGPSGQGKSFVALELAACVSTGRPWHGQQVPEAGPVVYMAAEGASGVSQRLMAWCERMDLDPRGRAGVILVPEPVQSGERRWDIFVEQMRQLRPALVVIDTQARVTEGVNENDAGEMGVAVGAWERLRAATGACVLLVHHRGVSGAHGRGSTAVKGAVSTEIDVSKVGGEVSVKTVKQKDAPEAAALRLTMYQVRDSVVLVGNADLAADTGPFTSPVAPELTPRQRAARAIAHALIDARASGLTKAEARHNARTALGLPSTDHVRTLLSRGWADLVGLGRISKAVGREAYFFVELDGAPVLDRNPDKAVQGGPEVYVPEQ